MTGPGIVATDAECRKQLKYETISQTHCFIPVAVETLGDLGEEANTTFLKDLGRRIAASAKELRSFEFLMQCVIQRGNAACVLGTTSDNNNIRGFILHSLISMI